jgi:hypothetical protein
VLTVTLKNDQAPGEVSQDFEITTDIEGELPLKLTVSGKLVERPQPRPASGAE